MNDKSKSLLDIQKNPAIIEILVPTIDKKKFGRIGGLLQGNYIFC